MSRSVCSKKWMERGEEREVDSRWEWCVNHTGSRVMSIIMKGNLEWTYARRWTGKVVQKVIYSVSDSIPDSKLWLWRKGKEKYWREGGRKIFFGWRRIWNMIFHSRHEHSISCVVKNVVRVDLMCIIFSACYSFFHERWVVRVCRRTTWGFRTQTREKSLQ